MGYREHEFFGLKRRFGIEIELHDVGKKKGKARFWIEGKEFGEFKVVHQFSYLASGLKKLMECGSELWDEKFENKNPPEIFNYCMSIAQDAENYPPEKYYLLESVVRFAFFFGDQFDTANHIIYVRDNSFHFTWSINNNYSGKKHDFMKGLQYASVSIEVLKEVSERCILYFEPQSH